MHLSKGVSVSLWIVQSLLALTFVGTGIWKLAAPIPELAAKMPWMGQVSPSFLYAWGRHSKAPLA